MLALCLFCHHQQAAEDNYFFFIFLAFSATTMELCKQLQQPKKSWSMVIWDKEPN